MKAELRIGNYVTVDNIEFHPKLKDVVLKVTGISETRNDYSISLEHINQIQNTYYETYSQFSFFIKPIPLTEEWLLKFGWGQSDEHELCDNSNDVLFYYDYHFERFWIELDDSFTTNSICYNMNIKYVHQLQNLYFALTGKELQCQ